MIKKKKIIFVVCIILAAILIWNIAWTVHYFNLKGYAENIPSDGDGGYVTNDSHGNSYSVKLPDYLHFNGNLALVDTEFNSLIIWVSMFDTKTYGVRISTDGFRAYEMLLDENAQLLKEGNLANAADVYDVNEETIIKLYETANNFWELM